MRERLLGYWVLSWVGLISNIIALPIIALIISYGPPLKVANITLAISLGWPAAAVGIVACAGLLAERRWGVILTIVALSMALSVSLPYGIVRIVLVGDIESLGGLSLVAAMSNIFALIYWCRPIHRRRKRL